MLQFEFWPGAWQDAKGRSTALRTPRRPRSSPCQRYDRAAAAERLESRLADARLEGVMLTARELAHRLNNALAPTLLVLDLLGHESEISPRVQALVADAERYLEEALSDIRSLERVTHVATKSTPVGPALDLDRSVLPVLPRDL